MSRTILPEVQIRSQVFRLNLPYRLLSRTTKARWSTVPLQVQRITRSYRHASLTRQNEIRGMDGQHVGSRAPARANAQHPGAGTHCRQAIHVFLHATK
jgi:hypothetical protein